jgi:hypothetical protein
LAHSIEYAQITRQNIALIQRRLPVIAQCRSLVLAMLFSSLGDRFNSKPLTGTVETEQTFLENFAEIRWLLRLSNKDTGAHEHTRFAISPKRV